MNYKTKRFLMDLMNILACLSICFSYIIPVFKKQDNIDIEQIMHKSNIAVGDIPDGNDTEIYFWHPPSNGYGSFGYWEINKSFVKQFLVNNFKWRLQASGDNATWFDADELLSIGLAWNDANNSYKVNLTLNTSLAPKALYYRFDLACNKSLKNYTIIDGYEWLLRVPGNDTVDVDIFFNWSDIKDLVANGKVWYSRGMKDNFFWFRIQTVNKIVPNTVFVIDPLYGMISNVAVDSYEWDAKEGRVYSTKNLVRLNSSEYYLTCAHGDTGADYDGYLRTLRVSNDTGIIQKSVVESWEYDASDGYYACVAHIPDTDKYVVVYEDRTGGAGFIKMFGTTVTDTGVLLRDQITLTTFTQRGFELDLIGVTDNIYVVSYKDAVDSDGFLETWWIDNDGTINSTRLDVEEFDTLEAGDPTIVRIDSNTIAVAYIDENCWLVVKTYDISSSGIITSADSSNIKTPGVCLLLYPHIYHIAGNVFAIAYYNSTVDGIVLTLSISDSGVIGSIIDELIFAQDNSLYVFMFTVDSAVDFNPGVYGVTCQDGFGDGQMFTFNISSDGTIGDAIIDSLEFDTSYSVYRANIVHVNRNYYFMIYTGFGSDGWSKTFEIKTHLVPPYFDCGSQDGHLVKDSDVSYAVAHDSATGNIVDNLKIGQAYTYIPPPPDITLYTLYRSFVYFDTSSIPDAATITSGSFNFYLTYDISVTDFDMVIQNGMPTYPHDPYVEADYNKDYYSGDGGYISTSGMAINNWYTIELNSSSLGWINKTGWTKFCLRSQKDISNSAPTTDEYIQIADSSLNFPYIIVNYSTGEEPEWTVSNSGFHLGGNNSESLGFNVSNSGYHLGGNVSEFDLRNWGFHLAGNSSNSLGWNVSISGFHLGGNVSEFGLRDWGYHLGGNNSKSLGFNVSNFGFHLAGNVSEEQWIINLAGYHTGGNNSDSLGFNVSNFGYHLGGNNSNSLGWNISVSGFHLGGNVSDSLGFNVSNFGYHLAGNVSEEEWIINLAGYHLGGNNSNSLGWNITNSGFHLGGNVSEFGLRNWGYHLGGNASEEQWNINLTGYHFGGNETLNWNVDQTGYHLGGNNSDSLGFNISNSGYHLAGNVSEFSLRDWGYHLAGNVSEFDLRNWGYHLAGNISENSNPIQSGESPTNGSDDVSIFPLLNVTVSDVDSDLMNVTWYSNSTVSNLSYSIIDPIGSNDIPLYRMPHERLLCYVNNTYWAFYENNTGSVKNTLYSSSSDGVNWNAPVIIRPNIGRTGADFSIAVFNDEIHYIWAYKISFGGETPKYRKGIFCSNGTIVWVASEQEIASDYEDACDPSICVDSNGYPWVSWLNATDALERPVISKSSTKDGTWNNDTGYPMEIAPRENRLPVIVPLTGGKMYCVYPYSTYTGSSQDSYGKYYNGTSWEDEETLMTGLNQINTGYFGKFSVVAIDDVVHVVYQQENINKILYTYRDGGGWNGPSIINASWTNTYTSPVITKNTVNDDLYCIFAMNNEIHVHTYNNSVWGDTAFTILDVDTDFSSNDYDDINAFYEVTNSVLGVGYRTLNSTVNYLNFIKYDLTGSGSGDWEVFGTNNSVSSGTNIMQTNSNFSDYDTTYWWKVVANDGEGGETTEIYHFTTATEGYWNINLAGYHAGGNNSDSLGFNISNFGYHLAGNVSEFSLRDWGYHLAGNVSEFSLRNWGYHLGGNVSEFNLKNWGYHLGGNVSEEQWTINLTGYHFGGNETLNWNVDQTGYHLGGNNSDSLGFNISNSGYHLGGNVSEFSLRDWGYHLGGNVSEFNLRNYGYHLGGNVSEFNLKNWGYHLAGNVSEEQWTINLTGYHFGGNETLNWNVDQTGYHLGGNNSDSLGFNVSNSGYHLGGNVSEFSLRDWGYHLAGNVSEFSLRNWGYHLGGNVSEEEWNITDFGYHLGGNVSEFNLRNYGYHLGGNISIYPHFSNETPANGSTIYTTSISWHINITCTLPFNWTINCSNGQNSSNNMVTNGTFYLNLTSLSYYTVYTVWVNATNGNETTNASYIFTVMPVPYVSPGGVWVPPVIEEEAEIPEPEIVDRTTLIYTGVIILFLFILFLIILVWKRKKKR